MRRSWRRLALDAAALASLGFILVPLVFVTWLAFFKQEIPSFPPEGYTLHWFSSMLTQKAIIDGFVTSVEVGLVATLIGLALGVPAALGLVRHLSWWGGAASTLLLMPLVVPAIVLGTAIYVAEVEAEILVYGFGIETPVIGTIGGLIAAHALIVIPWVVRLVTASLVGFDRSIEEAAQNLGATPWVTLRRVTLPGDPPRRRRGGALRLRHLLQQSRAQPVPRGRRAHHLADRDPAISRMEDRSDDRGGFRRADRHHRGRDAHHRSLRQAHAGGVMARVEIENLSKRYGENFVVKDLSIDIPQGEFLVLLGPSGCGKTTTLRMIAGFVEPSSGRITLGGRDVTTLPPWKRNTGLVFQSYALFPHLSVEENVAFGLEMRKMPAEETRARVAEALRLVRLEGFGERLPRQLSGGQQQRVALARALAFRPDVLLLDEPLSNLDAKLREEVRVEIRELQQKLGLTTVMVTHDQDEALSMADRLVVMAQGEVRQIGTQRDLYERPAGRFVAGFVGRSNFLEGKVGARRRLHQRRRPSHRLRRRPSPARGRSRFAPKPSRSAPRPPISTTPSKVWSNTSPISERSST